MCFTLGIGLVLLTTAAWGQTHDQSAAFHVTWKSRTSAVARTIEGEIQNGSPYRVTDVRLLIEGFDADSHPVGQIFAWALGDIAPGRETSFVAESVPGAVTYRISVVSYDLVSVPAAHESR